MDSTVDTAAKARRSLPRPRAGWLAGGALALGMAVAALVFQPATFQGRSVNAWLRLAASPAHPTRNAAEVALEAMGAPAVPDLTAALRSRETFLRRAGAWCDQHVFRRGDPPVPAARRRELAAACLARLGSVAVPATPALIECLGDPETAVVDEAGRALRAIGVAAVGGLTVALRFPNPDVRREAVELLGHQAFRTRAHEIIPVVREASRDSEALVRAAALRTLGGFHDPACVPVLAVGLGDRDPQVRVAAAASLAELGRLAAAAAPGLRRRLEDSSPAVQNTAARSLWRVTGETAEALPVLERAVTGPEGDYHAALVLAEMGPAAAPTIPALLRRLEIEVVHRPSRTPSAAALALGAVGPAAVPGLIALLHHARTEVRVGAAVALTRQGPAAAPAVPILLALVEHPDAEVQITAVDALGAIGPAAHPALPRLQRLAIESSDYLRAAAINAIAAIDHGPQPAAIELGPAATPQASLR